MSLNSYEKKKKHTRDIIKITRLLDTGQKATYYSCCSDSSIEQNYSCIFDKFFSSRFSLADKHFKDKQIHNSL